MSELTWIDPDCDRSEWPAGPWDGEPDKVQWVDDATGLVCLAKRQPLLGHWCGYVGIDSGHPWHGKDYEIADVCGVHGGLTFADACQEGPIASTVCHLPEPGQSDGLWWFGFDCSHHRDFSPSTAMLMKLVPSAGSALGTMYPAGAAQYRDLAYVRGECAKLAMQINAVKSTS